ncbi:MFS transporter [Pseudoxanthomonas sp. JBR18]|uniref:MFS transporter n=1 Tax=Pseudoxanthomonas sp. JBR18 TaxID=2969308 RepID=UPI0023062EFA|nr:MFS transporter [Pseudoxanthomonas sp. JBR18]WCE03984.1 MFS transporter [Pseudoxanthomonas sp. JBR18]
MSVPPPADTAVGAREVLAQPGFIRILAYRICAILSYQVVAVSVGWHIYQITQNPLSLGLIGLAEVLPFVCTAPFAGYLVDHLPRRRLGMTASTGLLLTPLVLLAVDRQWLPVDGVWPMYAAVCLTGAVRCFLTPVYNALFARVLERRQFARGTSIANVFFQVGLVTGPALGGGLVAWGGTTLAYSVAVVLAAVAIAVLYPLKVAEPIATGPRAPVFKSIAEGTRFVFSNQIMLGAMALDMFSVLLGGAVSMLPAFIHDILHHGPEGLGILRACPSLGAVVAGLWIARHPIDRHAGHILMIAVAAFGLCTIAFGLSRSFWLSAAILVVYGLCDGVSMVLRSTILQLATPDEMRGRVSSINSIFISSSNELGAFYDGVMARFLGLVPAVLLGGCVTLCVVGLTALKAPKLRRVSIKDL